MFSICSTLLRYEVMLVKYMFHQIVLVNTRIP